MSRNITLALDEETLRKARILAAGRNQSVSALLREELHRLVARGDTYDAAHAAARRRLERGARLGGGPLPTREELHDRAGLR
jgi:predicted transcriptional regulator